MNYAQYLQKLYQVNLFGGIKLGLENSLALDRAMNFPSKAMRIIHVAGTNGKGSVSTKIAKGLEVAGLRTGLYTSPHLSCFRERIRINNIMIPESSVEKGLELLFSMASRENIHPTFFEFTTMLALYYYQQENVDFAVLETGLGGRLDATNIVRPELSIITSISLEHTEILGNTIESIAREKAGIIKPGIPILIGPRVPHSIIQEIAERQQAPLSQVHGNFETFEEENCAIAKAAMQLMKLEDQVIEEGLKARPPCRMEILNIDNKTIVFDVGHNPDGLLHLFKALQVKYPNQKPCVIFGFSKTKDIQSCVSILKANACKFYPVEAPNGRGVEPDKLIHLLLEQGIPQEKINNFPTISETIQDALKNYNLVLICGTFFIMSEARKSLNIIEPFDNIDVNEKFIRNIT